MLKEGGEGGREGGREESWSFQNTPFLRHLTLEPEARLGRSLLGSDDSGATFALTVRAKS